MDDPFDTALASVEELRDLYPPVLERAVLKDIGYFDGLCRRLIAGCSIAFLATHSAEGHSDVTPRGGQPGFVTVLDDHRLATPMPPATSASTPSPTWWRAAGSGWSS